MEQEITNSEKSLNEIKKENKFKKFILKHKLIVILLLAIIVIFSWAKIKIYSIENSFAKQKTEIVNNYEIKIDSLNISRMELVSKVFSWAIRSELTRENIEQVNQFFLNFVKEPKVKKLQLIDTKTSIIIISTDKKDEGQKITDPKILNSTELILNNDSLTYKITTPIMGLNNKIGILVIESTK